MGYVFNPLTGVFDIDKGHGDILAPSAASNNQIALFADATHIRGATGNGLVQSTGGIYGVISTGAINATAPLTISGVGKAVGGSVSAVVTTGNIQTADSLIGITGGTAASLSTVTIGIVKGTTTQYLRGDATWQNFPALTTSGNVSVISPMYVTGETNGVLMGSGAEWSVTTGNINAVAPLSITGAGKAVGGSVSAVVTTATATVNAPVVITGVGNVLSATNISVTTATPTGSAPMSITGAGSVVGTLTINVTTATPTASAPLTITGAGSVVGAFAAEVTTATATGTAPIAVSGVGQVLSAMAVTVTTATPTASAPVVVTGAGSVVGSLAIEVTTATPTASAPLVITGAGSVVGAFAAEVTTGNITGTGLTITGAGRVVGGSVNIAVSVSDASKITMLPLASVTTSYSGVCGAVVASNNVVFGDVCKVMANTQYSLAKADAIANASGIAMCAAGTLAAGASGNFLFDGFATNTSWAWTVGGLIYLSTTGTTTNTMTQTAPTGANNVIQVLGVATSQNIVYFRPSLVQVEHV